MRARLSLVSLLLPLASLALAAGKNPAHGVRLSFQFCPQRAGDTFSVWVENAAGDTVLRLSGTAPEADALTGASAPQGIRKESFVWDFTDSLGRPVPEGDYTVLLRQADAVYRVRVPATANAGRLTVDDSAKSPRIAALKAILKR